MVVQRRFGKGTLRNERLLPITICLGVLCGGCASIDEYTSTKPSQLWQPPAAVVAQGSSDEDDHTEDHWATVVADSSPLTLADVIDIALQNNQDTRVAWFQARETAAQLGQAKSGYYPSVAGTINAQHSDIKGGDITLSSTGDVESLEFSGNTYNPALSLNWLLFNFGEREAMVSAAYQSLYEANFTFNQQLQDLVLDVVTAYYKLHSAQSEREAIQALHDHAQATYEAAKKRFDSGLGDKQDMLQAWAKVKSAEAQLAGNKATIETSRAALAVLLGVRVSEKVVIAELPALPDVSDLNRSVDKLFERALRRRPKLLAAIARKRAAKSDVDVARADFWPQLSIQSSAAYTGYMNSTASGLQSYTAALVLNWDIFKGFNRVYEVQRTRAALRQAQAAQDAAELAVAQDVWSAYFDYTTAQQKLEASTMFLEAQQAAFEAIRLGYQSGINSILDLLTAQQDLYEAQSQVIISKADLGTSLASLAHAVGDTRLLPAAALS